MKSFSLLPSLSLVLFGVTKGTVMVYLRRLLESQMANQEESNSSGHRRTRQASLLAERELHCRSSPLSGAFGPHTRLQRHFSEQQQKNILNLLKNNKYILLWVKFDDRLNALSPMLVFSASPALLSTRLYVGFPRLWESLSQEPGPSQR